MLTREEINSWDNPVTNTKIGISMNNYLPTDYQAFIHTSRYARWLDKE